MQKTIGERGRDFGVARPLLVSSSRGEYDHPQAQCCCYTLVSLFPVSPLLRKLLFPRHKYWHGRAFFSFPLFKETNKIFTLSDKSVCCCWKVEGLGKCQLFEKLRKLMGSCRLLLTATLRASTLCVDSCSCFFFFLKK